MADDATTIPCLGCGACCAFYRCSFYWAEADDATPGGVPAGLTEKLNDFRRYMRGMEGSQPRCVALDGTVGRAVRCTVHARRPSVCRAFVPSWAAPEPNPRCDKARAAHGLPPLRPSGGEGVHGGDR